MPAPELTAPPARPRNPAAEYLRDYFSRVAPVWEKFRRKNYYYHNYVHAFVQSMVPPGKQVLEIGSGTGDLLQTLRPARGIGLNLSEALTQSAQQKFPALEFQTMNVDRVVLPTGFKPDYVVLTNMLDCIYDISEFLENLRPSISEETLLIITTSNPLWAPLLRLGSRWGMRIPDSPRNFITNKDIRNVLQVEEFDVVQEGLFLPVPRWIPLLADALNLVIPEIPIIRYVSSVQYILARPHLARKTLSCSVVVPCHNEESNIEECIRRIPAMGAHTEIIAVDDGSTDKTRERVLEAMKDRPHVHLLATDRNQGKANAVRAGFENARGDIVMILDADMTVLPEDLPRFLKPLQNGSADFVNGTRLVYPMAGRAMRIINFFGNKAFCFLVSWVLRQRVSDTLCGTKALFRRDVAAIDHSQKERWGDFEILFGAARLKLRILEIPIHYHERRLGQSKMRVVYDGWLFFIACLHGWKMLRVFNPSFWESIHPRLTDWKELGKEKS